jgi:periplasmic protein TonB
MNNTRRRLRPPAGLPFHSRRKGWQGTVASVAVHALLVALLLSPAVHSGFSGTPAVGGGGPGDPGGGGGGGGARAQRSAGDRLQFVTIRPAPAPPPEAVAAVPDASQVRPPEPQSPAAPALPTVPVGTAIATGEGEGSGGGTGAGAGPGTGGGVGSGIGTGRGSGVGPGTGGGPGEIYPPTPTQFFLPPLPAPERIKPYHLIAWFDVDERGNATLLSFNPSRDAGYNRRLRDVLLTLRFRPAVRADGTPVRDTVDIHYIF